MQRKGKRDNDTMRYYLEETFIKNYRFHPFLITYCRLVKK